MKQKTMPRCKKNCKMHISGLVMLIISGCAITMAAVAIALCYEPKAVSQKSWIKPVPTTVRYGALLPKEDVDKPIPPHGDDLMTFYRFVWDSHALSINGLSESDAFPSLDDGYVLVSSFPQHKPDTKVYQYVYSELTTMPLTHYEVKSFVANKMNNAKYQLQFILDSKCDKILPIGWTKNDKKIIGIRVNPPEAYSNCQGAGVWDYVIIEPTPEPQTVQSIGKYEDAVLFDDLSRIVYLPSGSYFGGGNGDMGTPIWPKIAVKNLETGDERVIVEKPGYTLSIVDPIGVIGGNVTSVKYVYQSGDKTIEKRVTLP